MEIKWILLIVVVIGLYGCQGQAAKSEMAGEETAVNQTSDADAVAQRVQEIYAAVFKVYNEEDSLRNLDIEMEFDSWKSRDKFNNDFCSKEWNALLAKVNEIDSLYHSGEMGFWEADYWIMGQDWHELSISDLEVMAVTPSEAAVQIKLHNCGSVSPIALMLVKEDDIWKIDNFLNVENNMNWKKSMEDYVKEETANNK